MPEPEQALTNGVPYILNERTSQEVLPIAGTDPTSLSTRDPKSIPYDMAFPIAAQPESILRERTNPGDPPTENPSEHNRLAREGYRLPNTTFSSKATPG